MPVTTVQSVSLYHFGADDSLGVMDISTGDIFFVELCVFSVSDVVFGGVFSRVFIFSSTFFAFSGGIVWRAFLIDSLFFTRYWMISSVPPVPAVLVAEFFGDGVVVYVLLVESFS